MGLLRFFIPDDPKIQAHIALANLSDDEIQTHTHALSLCPSCGYVLCSCGNCHSQECNEICRYELG